MVAARLEGGGGAQVTVGGQRLDLSGGAAAPAEEDEVRGVFESLGFDEDAPAVSTRTMTGRELLLGSSFNLSAGGEGDGPAWAAWGRVATGGFDAAEDGVRMSGSVTSAFLGADVARGRWLAGLALSMSEGEGDYTHEETGAGGDVESTLTAVYPYARLKRERARSTLWGLAGWGTGELTLTHGHPDDAEAEVVPPRTSRCAWARSGARGEVLSPREPDGLAARAEDRRVLGADDVGCGARRPRQPRGVSEADATRLRLTLEGSRRFETGGGHLTPRLELGLRHDGGDAETGSGVELGASVRYQGEGVSAEGSVRTLIAHESARLRGVGCVGRASHRPGRVGAGACRSRSRRPGGKRRAARSGSGRWRTRAVLRPMGRSRPGGGSRRSSATGSRSMLWALHRHAEARARARRRGARGAPRLGARRGAAFGSRVRPRRRGRAERERRKARPGTGWASGFGWRLEGAAGGAFELRFEGERREAANDDDGAPEHRIGVRLGARW